MNIVNINLTNNQINTNTNTNCNSGSSRFNEQGRCPKCGGYNINYEAIELLDDCLYYPAICNDCKTEFEEYYTLTFDTIELR